MKDLENILRLHKDWLERKEGGVRANLKGTNLEGVNLEGENLTDANLAGSNLAGSNLKGANLLCADLRGANLRDANLMYANLDSADLLYANLRGANFWGTIGNGREVITIQTQTYVINIIPSTKRMQIGCKRYTIDEWFSFTDETISSMDSKALSWWEIYNPIIKLHLDALDLKT